jgi:hypothetical protein
MRLMPYINIFDPSAKCDKEIPLIFASYEGKPIDPITGNLPKWIVYTGGGPYTSMHAILMIDQCDLINFEKKAEDENNSNYEVYEIHYRLSKVDIL